MSVKFICLLLLFFASTHALGQQRFDQGIIVSKKVKILDSTISTENTNGDLTIDMNGTGRMLFTDLTASTVPYLDSSKKLQSSSATDTQLGYLANATSNLCGINQSCILQNKTLDGDLNTIEDLSLTSLKTVLGDASNFLVRNASGTVVSNTKAVPTGAVVGTSDSQTLTSKTLTSPAINGANLNFGTATNTNRLLLPNDTTTNLDALTDTAGLLGYDTTLSKPVFNNGSGWTAIGSGTGPTWFVDANIAGGNPSLGSTDQTAYVPIENGSLTLTNNTSTAANVLTAQIGCSSTNAPSGTTCSAGNESVAVAFTIPGSVDQYVEACFDITHELVTGAGGFIIATFQIVETATNAQTILQQGKGRTSSGLVLANANVDHPIRVCGTFTLSPGQRMLRLMYEQDVNATVNTNIVVADGGANYGQHDIHITVHPLSF